MILEAFVLAALSVFLIGTAFFIFVTALDSWEEYKQTRKKNRL